MYGTRNGKKRTVMQDMSNLTSNVANSDKNSKVLQKIPLVEVTQPLRPRRGDRNNVPEKICKENNFMENNCKENNFTEKNFTENHVPRPKLMASMSHFKSNKASSIEHVKIPQKIPLTEVTKTLRPRKGCKNRPAENNCKENQIPQSKSAVNNKKHLKTDTSLILKSETNITQKKSAAKNSKIKKTDQILIQKSRDEVSSALPISGKDLKNKTVSKSRILQSIQNFNLKSNNSESKVKNKRKAPLNQKAESREKKRKIETSCKISKDSCLMRKFPKWLSNGVESLRQGKKRSCNSDVYDIETDKDLMFEKPVTKKVVKRAKITETKNYPSKHDYHTMRGKNSQTQLNKNYRLKEVMGKFHEKHRDKFEKSALKASEHLEPKQITVVGHGANNLLSNESVTIVTESVVPNAKKPGAKNFDNLNIPIPQPIEVVENSWTSDIIENNNEHEKAGKRPEKLKTPEKCRPRNGVSSLMEDIENSFNFQLFPMPQASSTPQNVDKPNMAALMLCSGFDATMLEIPQSQSMQVHVSDTEFLSIEKMVPDSNEIQLFESSFDGQRKQTIKGKPQEKPSAVKNLNASLKVVETEHVTRPRRECQQNKPVINESSDIESSSENDCHEITLFDSPEKKSPEKEDSPKCSPSKAILKKLFPEEFDVSPVKVINVEEKVLKPRKSYHSPAQFRRHIVKAKKENKVPKKAKTKQEKLMEDLNNHFLELENMELCIE